MAQITLNSTGVASNGALTLQSNGTTTAISIGTNQNVNFPVSGQRITGDFSNATIASRVMFQSSTTNANTLVAAIPNGTSTTSGYWVFNNSDLTNAGRFRMTAASTEMVLTADFNGTGTYLPMTFSTGGSERVRIDTSGNVLVTSAAGLGYGTGSGGTVTQATSKSTAVTLNKPTGQITMNNAALAGATAVEFSVNNSLLSINDCINLSGVWGASPNYRIELKGVFAGGFAVRVTNITAGSLSEALVLNFALIKGATS